MKKVLLLHGAIGSKNQLEPLANLLESDFEVLSLNFSGHGGDIFQERFNIPQFAKEVIQFLDENDLDKIDVFGYSMGGYVALYVAKHFPERIAEIITLGTKFKWSPEIAQKEMKMLNTQKIQEKIPAFASVLAKRHLPNDWKELLNRTAHMMLEMGEKNPIELEDYKTINHRVKIGLADKDEMVSEEETQAVYEALPNAMFYTLNESNHPIEKVNITQLADEIKSFLK